MKPSQLTFATVKPEHLDRSWPDLDPNVPHEVEDVRNGDGDLTYPALKLRGVAEWVACEWFNLDYQEKAEPEMLKGSVRTVAEIIDEATYDFTSYGRPIAINIAKQLEASELAYHTLMSEANGWRLKYEMLATGISEVMKSSGGMVR